MKVWVRTFDVTATGGYGAWIAGTPTGRTRVRQVPGYGPEEQREIVIPASRRVWWWPTSADNGEVDGVFHPGYGACSLSCSIPEENLPEAEEASETSVFAWSNVAPHQRLPFLVT